MDTGIRAMKYEERNRWCTDKELVNKCCIMRGVKGMLGSKIDKERESYLWRCGWSSACVVENWSLGKSVWYLLRDRDRLVQDQILSSKIENSRYNEWYVQLRTEGLPRYLRKEYGYNSVKRRMIARMRCGCEWKGCKYWLKMDDRLCRKCFSEIENIGHVVYECRMMNVLNHGVRKLFSDSGFGWTWLNNWIS